MNYLVIINVVESHASCCVGLRSSFGVLWFGGMDRERVANSNDKLVKCYLW